MVSKIGSKSSTNTQISGSRSQAGGRSETKEARKEEDVGTAVARHKVSLIRRCKETKLTSL